MRAAIIAAGEGSRLRSEGLQVPKPLVRVNGVPLIERLIGSFHRCGISDVVCIINDASTAVRDYVDGLRLPGTMTWVVKSTPSSMHSLLELAPYLQDDQFLLSTVDPVFPSGEFDRYVAVAKSRNGRADGILAVTRFVDDENPLYVRLDEEGRILQFSKTEQEPWITGGMYVFSPGIFREKERVLAAGTNRLRNFLGHLVASGYRLETFPFSTIVDVDRGHDIAVAEELLRTL